MTDELMLEREAEDNGSMFASSASRKQSRRCFLRRSVVGASVVVPAGLVAACGSSGNAAPTKGSGAIAVEQTPTIGGTGTAQPYQSIANSKAAFEEIMNDEKEHVKFLQDAVTKAGGTPRPKPTFKGLQQTDLDGFATLSQSLENTGVGAYLMAAPSLTNKDDLAAGGSILSVEARHAGFVNHLTNKPLSTNGAFDKPLTQTEVVNAVTPYIENLNGGSDPAGALNNDTDVLNFALLLEYLESEFYSTNVPKLFK